MDDGLDEVRDLVSQELRGALTGRELIDRCTAAALSLRGAEVSEAIWHYLSDADIRVKDPRYAALQLPHVVELLGVAPLTRA